MLPISNSLLSYLLKQNGNLKLSCKFNPLFKFKIIDMKGNFTLGVE
jgi:hypothetical protein